MYSFAALSLAVLGNLFVVESVPEKSCRCEAPFESLYDRRHRPLLEGLDRGLKLSLQDGFPYDYGTAYTIDVGYFVIDGVIVLPDSSEICQTLDHGNAGVMAWMEPLGRRRNLAVDSNQQSSRALRGKLQIAQHAKMRGMKGVMSNAVGNDQRDSSQRYFTYKGRKTDGKGVGMRKATAQGNGHAMQTTRKNQGPCSKSNDYSPECLPEIFPCENGTASPIDHMSNRRIAKESKKKQKVTDSPRKTRAPSFILSPSHAPTSLPTSSPLGIPIATTCPDGSVGPRDPKNCATKCDDDADIFERGCSDLCSSSISLRDVVYGCICTGNSTDPATCKEACCPPDAPTSFPTASPLGIPIATTCPDGSVGPRDPENCATKCDDGADIFELGCSDLCTSKTSLRDVVYGCICTGNSTDPTTCKDACCPSDAPTSFPTASPLGIPIVNTCPDGSIGPRDPENCATKCDDDADFFELGCSDLCSSKTSLRDVVYGCICTGNVTDPSTCKEACCPPFSSSPSTSPTSEPSIAPSLPPTLLPTAAPLANIIPACNITDDCPESLNQCERFFCNASSTCQLEPDLDCNDNNPCTIDSCSAAVGCEHVRVSCSQNESCDAFNGQCKPNESLRPCIAVIDESDMTNATVNSKWASFRAGYPDRPFCLLRPIKTGFLNLPTNPDFLSDPRTIYSNVSRDEGDSSLASDWFTSCGISLLNSTGVDFVGLFIDTSGSMTLNTVRASYEKFISDLNATNLSYCTVANSNEDWITPFNTTLGEIGGGGQCVVSRQK